MKDITFDLNMVDEKQKTTNLLQKYRQARSMSNGMRAEPIAYLKNMKIKAD